MGLTQLNFEGENRVEVAINRLKQFEPPEGYYLAFSGGKDSVSIYQLAKQAGVKFDAHYSMPGIDPPELVYFIRDEYPDVERHHPPMSIWKAIQLKGMPRRQSRWCCALIKEGAGSGRIVMTGIRWEESAKRRTRSFTEICKTDLSKRFIHPIIDWSTEEVWEYIRGNKFPYCSLYDEGFKRLGCILCPFTRNVEEEMMRYPKTAEAWRRACYRYFNSGHEGTKRWKTAEDMWQWWLDRDSTSTAEENLQCPMFV